MSNLKNILFYSTQQGNVHVEVVYNNETFWLTQKAMALLFGVEVPAISKHLKNIFETKELEENSVVSKMETTAKDGKNYNTTYYRLEAILAVGYRVNSAQATQFRIWATNSLKEFITKEWWDKNNQQFYTHVGKDHLLKSRGFDYSTLYFGSFSDSIKLRKTQSGLIDLLQKKYGDSQLRYYETDLASDLSLIHISEPTRPY